MEAAANITAFDWKQAEVDGAATKINGFFTARESAGRSLTMNRNRRTSS
ncbi:MAG: hypothetical protein LBK00_09755 [Treponema sp.]|nr:hypothetical protein [Treponema sp.]